jgi:hypothetical protein
VAWRCDISHFISIVYNIYNFLICIAYRDLMNYYGAKMAGSSGNVACCKLQLLGAAEMALAHFSLCDSTKNRSSFAPPP